MPGFKLGECKESSEDTMEQIEDAIPDVQKTPQKVLPHKRSGCGAFIHVKQNKFGKWAIKTLNNEHNHALIVSPSKKRCALLRDEGKLSFEWLFTTWMKAMNGKHPTAIITDQDPAMRAAIEKIFPNTVHRSCQWHVMRKAREHLGVLYGQVMGFKEELFSCINGSLTVKAQISENSRNIREPPESEVDRYNALHVKWLKILDKGSKDCNAYNLAFETFKELDKKLTVNNGVDLQEKETKKVNNEEVEYHDPPVSQCRGKRKP